MGQRKVKIPRKVTLQGDTVTIQVQDHNGRMPGGYRVSGTYKNDKVNITDGLTRRREQATVLHELLHKIWERAGLHSHFSDKTEEFILAELDEWILLLLRENPDLLDYLMEDE